MSSYAFPDRNGAPQDENGLPKIPTGSFRVFFRKGTKFNPKPYRDVKNDATTKQYYESEYTDKLGRTQRETKSKPITYREIFESRLKKEFSQITKIVDGPGAPGRPKNADPKAEAPKAGVI